MKINLKGFFSKKKVQQKKSIKGNMPSSARRRGGRKHRKASVLRLKGGYTVLIPKHTPTCDIFACEKMASHFCAACNHSLCPKCTLQLLKADISLMNGFSVFATCPFCRENVRICNLQSFEVDQPCKLKNMMLWGECANVTINLENGATMNLKHILHGKNPDNGEIKATFEVETDLMMQIAQLGVSV